jgi:hypothetical protein
VPSRPGQGIAEGLRALWHQPLGGLLRLGPRFNATGSSGTASKSPRSGETGRTVEAQEALTDIELERREVDDAQTFPASATAWLTGMPPQEWATTTTGPSMSSSSPSTACASSSTPARPPALGRSTRPNPPAVGVKHRGQLLPAPRVPCHAPCTKSRVGRDTPSVTNCSLSDQSQV